MGRVRCGYASDYLVQVASIVVNHRGEGKARGEWEGGGGGADKVCNNKNSQQRSSSRFEIRSCTINTFSCAVWSCGHHTYQVWKF